MMPQMTPATKPIAISTGPCIILCRRSPVKNQIILSSLKEASVWIKRVNTRIIILETY